MIHSRAAKPPPCLATDESRAPTDDHPTTPDNTTQTAMTDHPNTQTLSIQNGPKTDDLKVHISLDGVFVENDSGEITLNIADETADIPFRGEITLFDVVRGAGSASIDGEPIRFRDLVGYDTREHAGESTNKPAKEPKPNPNTNPKPNPNTPASDSTTVPTSDTGSSVANERPRYGAVARSWYSQGPIEMHVGDGRAYGTLQAAFNDIPHYVLHDAAIHVHGRTRDSNTAHIHTVSMANDPHFVVDGSDNGVIANGGVNVNINAKLDHVRFDNLEFEMISQCINARFENCVFGHNGRACFSGKTGGKMLVNCRFKGGATYAVESIGNEMVEIRGGKLRAEKAAIHAIGASVHVLTGGVDTKAPRKMDGRARDVYIGGERVA